MSKAQKITIYDIAKLAGTSAAAVSSALNGSWKARRISEKTANRIQKIAADNGFSVNLQARGLRKARSGLVGMILPEHNNRFFSELSQCFGAEVRQREGCPAIVSTRRDAKEEKKVVSNLISYAIEALFIVGASDPDELSLLCKNANIPHVFVDQPCDMAPSVVTDNFLGSKQLTQYLLNTMPTPNEDPKSALYFLGGDASLPATSSRIAGFKDVFLEQGSTVEESHIVACGYDKEAARTELDQLYKKLGGLPAGLLINSIGCFEGALNVLSGLPEDEIKQCTIGCYDYDPFGALLSFPVHMIKQRAGELIRTAYRSIESGSKEASLTLIKPDLILPNQETVK